MKIKFCGATQNVTGSKHLISVNGLNILLDCGLVQGGNRDKAREQNEKFLFEPKQVDYLILSHGHIDHSGLIPRLVKQGFRGKIFCTTATKELAEVLLLDSAHIQMENAKYVKRHLKKNIEPLYKTADTRRAMKYFETYEYRRKFKIGEGIWCTFNDAGHVLGSAIVTLDIKEENVYKRLVFTGDLGRKNMPILNDPYQVEQADILITESTYASHLHDSMANVHQELSWAINDVVKRSGKVIVPGFSFERTQELVYVLHELYRQNKIPKVPIFVDSPLSSRISKVFDKFKNYYDDETFRDFLNKKKNPFYFEQIKYIESREESKKLNNIKEPCIIISASGMCEAGRIKHHLKNHMGDARNLILVIGFMAQGTRGRQIVEGKSKIRIFGKLYPLKADVTVINAFSAHADKLELLEYIKNIHGLENIFIVHGEETECAVLRDNIYNILKLRARVDVVDLGEEFKIREDGTYSKLGKRRKKYLREMQNITKKNKRK